VFACFLSTFQDDRLTDSTTAAQCSLPPVQTLLLHLLFMLPFIVECHDYSPINIVKRLFRKALILNYDLDRKRPNGCILARVNTECE
jgi:hypothetical protein